MQTAHHSTAGGKQRGANMLPHNPTTCCQNLPGAFKCMSTIENLGDSIWSVLLTESVMLGPWPIESVLQLAKFSGYLPKRNATTKLLYEPYEGLQNERRKSLLKYLFKYPAKKHLESHLPNPSSFGWAGVPCGTICYTVPEIHTPLADLFF